MTVLVSRSPLFLSLPHCATPTWYEMFLWGPSTSCARLHSPLPLNFNAKPPSLPLLCVLGSSLPAARPPPLAFLMVRSPPLMRLDCRGSHSLWCNFLPRGNPTGYAFARENHLVWLCLYSCKGRTKASLHCQYFRAKKALSLAFLAAPFPEYLVSQLHFVPLLPCKGVLRISIEAK